MFKYLCCPFFIGFKIFLNIKICACDLPSSCLNLYDILGGDIHFRIPFGITSELVNGWSWSPIVDATYGTNVHVPT